MPPALKDYVGLGNPVRFLAPFVVQPDLRALEQADAQPDPMAATNAAELQANITRRNERKAQDQDRMEHPARGSGGRWRLLQEQDFKTCQEIGMEPHLPAVVNSPRRRPAHRSPLVYGVRSGSCWP